MHEVSISDLPWEGGAKLPAGEGIRARFCGRMAQSALRLSYGSRRATSALSGVRPTFNHG